MFRRLSSFIRYTVYGIRDTKGQLLVEVLISVAVASLLLAGATTAILGVIRHNFESRGNQIATALASDLSSKVGSFAESDWHNIYNLPKGSGNQYYLVSSSTAATAVSGQESILSNDVAAGLVGHWKLDEDIGLTAYDSSGNGNTGTLVNDPARQSGTNCRVGSCLSFNSDNSQYISVVPSGSLSSNFTVMGWGKPNTTAVMDLVGTRSPNEASFDMKFQNGNTIHGDIGNGTGWITTAADASFNYSTGTWYHVVYVVTPTSYTIYVNGNNVGSGTYATSTPLFYDSNHYIYIGQYGGSGEYFNGNIDDVRVYNRALSANEIKQLYQSSVYSRYFYTESASRDAGGDIESTYNVNNDDPSTQKITSVVVWEEGRENEIGGYLTRSRRNSVFWQQDWSGGSGQEGPISEVNDRYSSSDNVTAGASLQITDKNLDGTLYSSTFDTQVSGGAVFNSILWRGDKPSGTNVKFQIASSNSSSGPGGGATGTIDTFYHYAWNDSIGWIDFGYAPGNVQVQDTQLVGYAYNDDVEEVSLDCATSPAGDICLSKSNYKVFRNGTTGDLSGWAWNDEIGWISFCGGQQTADCPGTVSYKVNVNLTTGYFSGWAWNDAVGWISFNCADVSLCGVADYKVAVVVASGWRYLGPDGTSLTFYVPTGSGIPSQITLKYHNNHRYFRYKIILSPDSGHTLTPTVDDVVINWSP